MKWYHRSICTLHDGVWGVIFFVRNYNPKEGRGSKKPVSREQAMEELLQVVKILTFSWIIMDLFVLFPFIVAIYIYHVLEAEIHWLVFSIFLANKNWIWFWLIISQIQSTKPDNFTPKITQKKDDYIRVEYESPILGVSLKK